jgi:starch synthase
MKALSQAVPGVASVDSFTPRHGPILMIASEALPFSKTGGLADVLGALPVALARLGWDVIVATPRYRGITGGTLLERQPIAVGSYQANVGFFETPIGGGARALLVDDPLMFDRDRLYGDERGDYPDNARRYALLVRSALEFMARRGQRPSVVHAHEWQAGLAPVYLNTLYASHPILGGVPSVFTIHNIAYQGLFEPDWLPRLDLPWELMGVNRMEYWGKISFLKGGITDARVVTTVSPQYAREIQTSEYGAGLDGLLRARSADVIGVLNGIDVEQWDPARDRYLPQPFSREDLASKSVSKAEVLKRYGFIGDGAPGRPLIGMISRMVDQKGLDLIAALGTELPRLDASFAILGTGDPRYQDFWRALAATYPDRIGVRVGFDEELAHLIEAGADLFLMPSRFEPCGLNQMYSLRYGTVPVVRRVGGLADTVVDYAAEPGRGNGFVFDEYTPAALLGTLQRALRVFLDREAWRRLQVTGMSGNYSWDRSAREYVKIYGRAAERES